MPGSTVMALGSDPLEAQLTHKPLKFFARPVDGEAE
jgi:hypothetical protein